MRVRLFAIGDPVVSQVFRLDELPSRLSEGPDGQLGLSQGDAGSDLCVLDEFDGNLVVEDCGQIPGTYVNELPVSRAALLPGDTLKVANHRLLVSYERTTSTQPPPTRYLIADARRHAAAD
jgi:hypothetical protein